LYSVFDQAPSLEESRRALGKSSQALHIAKFSKTSSNGSFLGFSALLVMTFYLVLVTDTAIWDLFLI